jgi:nitrite reductase/ring-hydroxylating ferredoxin subunit
MMLSSELRLLCDASDVPPGTARKIVIGRLVLAAFNLGGEFYVTDDTCTHGFASLSEGIIDGDIIECPWHGGTFDIRSGAPVDRPCTVPLNTYQTVVKDGAVWIELNGKAGN